jgi:RimJ/RimL family protein N-acetyltransferase
VADEMLMKGTRISIRKIQSFDLESIAPHKYTVSITEPLTDLSRLKAAHAQTGLWQPDSGAVAIVEVNSNQLVGTCQFYRSAPCIHGIELGYIIHAEQNRGKGYATEALTLFSSFLFATHPRFHRQQLVIETWNEASRKVAERGKFVREGILRSSGFDPDKPADCFIYSRTTADASP